MPNARRHIRNEVRDDVSGRVRPVITSLAPPVLPSSDGSPVAGLGRFWYSPTPLWTVAVSAALHAATVVAIVWTVGDVLDHPATSGESVFFIPPPQSSASGTRGGGSDDLPMVSLAYFSGPGPGSGTSGQADSAARLTGRLRTNTDQQSSRDAADSTAVADDNVYASYEVDNVVQISYGSVVPEYPPDLLARGVQGTVTARFIVDTSGSADAGSIEVISSSDPQFEASVRAALPRMRFSPARLNGRRVRQTVEQPFRFSINAPARNPTDSAAK
jgi:TonB family protein